MGLLDRLAEKGVDRALEGPRNRRTERAQLRRELADALRQFSSSLERLRQQVWRIRGQVECGERRASAVDLTVFSDSGGVDFDAPDPLDLVGFGGNAVAAKREALEGYALRELRENPAVRLDLLDYVAKAESLEIDLDGEWANLRPLLEDSVELETVSFLRETRHTTKHMIREVLYLVSAWESASMEDEQILAELDRLLDAFEVWDAHIRGTREGLNP